MNNCVIYRGNEQQDHIALNITYSSVPENAVELLSKDEVQICFNFNEIGVLKHKHDKEYRRNFMSTRIANYTSEYGYSEIGMLKCISLKGNRTLTEWPQQLQLEVHIMD